MQNEIQTTTEDPIQSKVREIDQQATGSVLVTKNQSFLKRLFPSKLYRDSAEHELRLADTEFEFREKALKVAREAQLQSIQEMFNDYLVKGKTQIRRGRAEFVLDQKIRLERTMMKATDDFNDKVTVAYEKADKISIPELKKKNIELIHDTIESYHALILELQAQFQSILSEGVQA